MVTEAECPAYVVGLSAFGLTEDGAAIEYGIVTLGADKTRRFLDLAERSGLIVYECWFFRAPECQCFRALDTVDELGNTVDSFHVPTADKWAAVNSELRLEIASTVG